MHGQHQGGHKGPGGTEVSRLCMRQAPPLNRRPLPQVDFIWITRDQRSFEWFVSLLTKLEMDQAEETREGRRGTGRRGWKGAMAGSVRVFLEGSRLFHFYQKCRGERVAFPPSLKYNIL